MGTRKMPSYRTASGGRFAYPARRSEEQTSRVFMDYTTRGAWCSGSNGFHGIWRVPVGKERPVLVHEVLDESHPVRSGRLAQFTKCTYM